MLPSSNTLHSCQFYKLHGSRNIHGETKANVGNVPVKFFRQDLLALQRSHLRLLLQEGFYNLSFPGPAFFELLSIGGTTSLKPLKEEVKPRCHSETTERLQMSLTT